MTEDEKGRCKLDTLQELAEMRSRRICLTTRAEKVQRELERGLAVARAALATEPGEEAKVEGPTPDEKNWPAYSDLVAVLEDTRVACARIHVLNDRLRKWGVID